jgi:hypothetical protein
VRDAVGWRVLVGFGVTEGGTVAVGFGEDVIVGDREGISVGTALQPHKRLIRNISNRNVRVFNALLHILSSQLSAQSRARQVHASVGPHIIERIHLKILPGFEPGDSLKKLLEKIIYDFESVRIFDY